ncbi:hypothetical protein OGAPHI_003049 [Ogataea philodendri]|uniref:Uncharacterized protein n=1 Tax=Ogataea philodendri TaxID=1378263 RepID=A0A9P8T6S1_9ASCO|nr:uncharacterized protein OGAPHI_003049 [Ogataea philodendri]KAH3667400.1 hypothetical protein OGAPHI_003049 [Ogataea philodendri]
MGLEDTEPHLGPQVVKHLRNKVGVLFGQSFHGLVEMRRLARLEALNQMAAVRVHQPAVLDEVRVPFVVCKHGVDGIDADDVLEHVLGSGHRQLEQDLELVVRRAVMARVHERLG